MSAPQQSFRSGWNVFTFLRLLVVLTLGCLPAVAQTGATLAAVGYQDPQWLIVAPGQVITLFITGASIVLPQPTAQDPAVGAGQLPLPTSLAGFSLEILQLSGGEVPLYPFLSGPVLLPLFSVEQTNHCLSAQSPGCIVTAITAEIPPDLRTELGDIGIATTLTILQNGVPGNPFSLSVLPVNPHVLTLCDSSSVNRQGIEANNSTCPSVVTHANGSLVSPSSPARPGETLVMYVFGLGPTDPPVPAGTATPMSLFPTQVPYTLLFTYRGATAASASPALSQPLFAGLTPGQVGLYQINFTVPMLSGPIADCSSPDGANLVLTLFNSTTDLGGYVPIQGLDYARICVGTAGSAGHFFPF